MDVGDAVATGGIYDVEVVGNLLAVRDGSGLIQRCPECYRVIQKGQCRTHGDVDGIDDLRVKAILDDGTGTVTVVLDDDLTERVYDGTLEDALEQAREAMDQEVVADRIRERIVGASTASGVTSRSTSTERISTPNASRRATTIRPPVRRPS